MVITGKDLKSEPQFIFKFVYKIFKDFFDPHPIPISPKFFKPQFQWISTNDNDYTDITFVNEVVGWCLYQKNIYILNLLICFQCLFSSNSNKMGSYLETRHIS